MRLEEHTHILNRLTNEEKANMTSYLSFSKRGNIIKKYQYRHLVRNEYPNNVGEEELVLFYKKKYEYPVDSAWVEFGGIRSDLFQYTVRDVHIEGRSVPTRYHIHFIK